MIFMQSGVSQITFYFCICVTLHPHPSDLAIMDRQVANGQEGFICTFADFDAGPLLPEASVSSADGGARHAVQARDLW